MILAGAGKRVLGKVVGVNVRVDQINKGLPPNHRFYRDFRPLALGRRLDQSGNRLSQW
jgi:hypothetical protein